LYSLWPHSSRHLGQASSLGPCPDDRKISEPPEQQQRQHDGKHGLPEPTKRIHVPAAYDSTMMVTAAKYVAFFDLTGTTADTKIFKSISNNSRSHSLTDAADTCSNIISSISATNSSSCSYISSSMDEDTVVGSSNNQEEGNKQKVDGKLTIVAAVVAPMESKLSQFRSNR
jgi:hypothetical protein